MTSCNKYQRYLTFWSTGCSHDLIQSQKQVSSHKQDFPCTFLLKWTPLASGTGLTVAWYMLKQTSVVDSMCDLKTLRIVPCSWGSKAVNPFRPFRSSSFYSLLAKKLKITIWLVSQWLYSLSRNMVLVCLFLMQCYLLFRVTLNYINKIVNWSVSEMYIFGFSSVFFFLFYIKLFCITLVLELCVCLEV